MSLQIDIDAEGLAAFCRRAGIGRLSFFGSVIRKDFGPDSDVDVLVEFDAGHVPGLITLAGMEMELAAALGRKVDLRTPEDLSGYFRADVVSSARLQYERR